MRRVACDAGRSERVNAGGFSRRYFRALTSTDAKRREDAVGLRNRIVKPELLDDEVMAGLSDAAWRLWLSLVLLSDDYGNSRAMARFLGARVWHDTSRDVAGPLRELIEKGRVIAYTVARNGVQEGFVHVQNWEKHQRLDNAGKPLVPGPDHPSAVIHSAHLAQLSPRTSANLGEIPRLAARARARGRGDSKSDRSLLSLSSSSEVLISDAKGDRRERGSDGPSAPPSPPKRAHRMPADWQPSPEQLDKMRRSLGVEPLGCLDAFRDWAVSAPKAVKCDWDATFRNWVRREAADGRLEPWAPPQQSSHVGTPSNETPEQQEAARKRLADAMADLSAKSGLRHSLGGK